MTTDTDRTTHLRGTPTMTAKTAAIIADALDPDRDFSGVNWKIMYEHGIRNRIAAVARLAAERDEANARADAAEAKVRELEHDRNLWRERAENGEPRPEVTKDDIAKAIRDGLYDDGWHATSALMGSAVRGVWNLLHPEPVDPVDALAEELYTVVGEGRFSVPSWDNLTDHARENYRRMAKHVIERKEADR